MTTTLQFNNLNTDSKPFCHLLYLIANHPLFEARVIEFRQLFPEVIKPEHLIQLGSLYWGFMLPEYTTAHHKRLATQMFEALQLDQATHVSYSSITEYLARICLNTLENIDVKNAVAFLDLLKSRVTDVYIVDVKSGQKRKIPYHIKLQLFDGETVINDADILEEHHRAASKDVYFEEKVFYEQESLVVTQTQVVLSELKIKAEDVVPYGFVCDDFMCELINADFTMKNSYKMRRNRRINAERIEYWISANEAVNNFIRDQVVNQQVFLTTGVLSASHLTQTPVPNSKIIYSVSRINRVYSHQNYYQKLKDTKTEQIKYFNILSEFYERDEFNIDEIALTRQKLIARRKEHLLGIQGRQTIKKQSRNFDEEVTSLSLRIVNGMLAFHDVKRQQVNVKQLSQFLKQKLEQDKNINSIIERSLSEHDSLPSDSSDPWTEDIINLSKKQPMQVLILGRPKSGKSTLARAVAKKYNLVYISVQVAINNIFERVKFFEENPPEVDQDGNVVGGLFTIEKCIFQDLNNGKAIEDEDVLDLINLQLEKQLTQSRGFILDLPFEYKKYWIDSLISNRINLPKICCRFFTHILQIEQTEEQWKYFVEGIMQKPEDLTLTSAYDRYLLDKPKIVPQQGEDEEEEAPADDDQEKPQPLKVENLIELHVKDATFSLIQHLTQHIHPKRYIKVHNSYLSVSECLQMISGSLYIIPLPKKIEGAEKELLTVGHDESKLARKWSPWGIVDPVELKNQKLIMGKFEFACEYAGRVFVFDSEKNQNDFINLPRKYMEQLPLIPNKTNICISGPRKSGKKTLAKMLSEIYGMAIINFEEIIEKVILRQKQSESHIPSNPEKRSKHVHLSEAEFKDFTKGNLLNAKDIMPIVLYQLGISLQKKPADWGVEKDENGQNAEPEEKKPAPVKKKKKDKNADDERPKTPPVEDLNLKEIIPQINHFGKLNEIKGYILINFPNNEEQLNAMKQFNVPIDKMIILNDNNEEAPNKVLGQRLSDAELEQVALFFNNIGPVKQALGEEICKQIPIDKTPEEILNKVRQIIDPFYLKVDDDSLNRVLADKQEEGDPIPMGFCGDYCPVALKEGWLIKGKEEFEAGVQGKRFKCCGQKEFNSYKENPALYLDRQNTIVPPRVMFMGLRGVGLSTQLLKFNEKHKIPILNLKETLLQQIEAEKNKRKTERYYKRGFKKPEFDEEGKQIEDEELNAQHPDFDKKADEIQITRKIFDGINEIFINGNFFDVDEEKISTNLVDLLTEARRLPQVLFVLKSQENKWLERNLDRSAIEKELELEIQKIRDQKRAAQEEAKRSAEQAGQEYQAPAEEEQQDLPKIQDKITAKQEALKAQRENDMGALEGFIQGFRALNIEVIQVNCQRGIKYVSDKINYSLQPYLEDRVARWEQNNMLVLQRHRTSDFISNYIAQDSRFGKMNPFTLTRNLYSFPLIYNERIYYLKDQEERQSVMKNPSILQANKPVPLDINIVPGVFVLGRQKSGKTTLVDNISKKLGLVKISFVDIIENFTLEHKDLQIQHTLSELRNGKTLSDQSVVKIVQKRLNMPDCIKNGWVMDGLPATKKQAELFNRQGIIPTAVFSLQLSEIDSLKRTINFKNTDNYEWDLEVVHQRLDKNRTNLREVELYYENKYNNIRFLDSKLSKWGLFETCFKAIQQNVMSRKYFSRAVSLHQAAAVSQIGLNFNCILKNISEYLNFCPINYKLKRQYIKKSLKQHQNLALYNRKIYVFNSEKELQDFLENPQTFTSKSPSFMPPRQVQIDDFKAMGDRAENRGYCMIELLRKNLVKGNSAYGLIYKNRLFLTSSPRNMKLFIRNPTLYEMVRIPDKLPVEFEKKNELKKIAKKNDCTAFLEHHLSNIMMRSLAQLGYRRPKYPTLSSKESALKFLAISLKATNPNKDDQYRQKYTESLSRFIKECNYSQEIRDEADKKQKGKWQQYDEENLIKLCEQYHEFIEQLEREDKIKYFSSFIR